MISWKIFGHDKIKSILSSQINFAKIPHAYLFAGPEGVGKKTLAIEFAQKVLRVESLDNHPDFHILDAEGEITAELALNFISKLSYKPFLADKKVAIINNAQNLNQQSSNALLKTIEEPSQSTVIILVANYGKLLPTIISRCQVFNFSAFTKKQLLKFSAENNITADDQIISLSFGSVGRLKQLAGSLDFFNRENLSVQKYMQISKLPISDKFLAISGYAESDNNQLEKDATTWLNWQLEDLKNSPENYTKVQPLNDFLQGLKMNKNKKLLLQSLFLKI